MRVALDLDNVVLGWQVGWIERYEHDFDRQVDITAAGLWDGHVQGTHFGSAAEFFHWMDAAGVWASLKPLRGALGAIWELQHTGHDVVFCTARPEGPARQTAVHFAYTQGVPIEFREPAEKHLTDADVWVDDSPEVLQSLRRHDRRAIRFVQPWNQSWQAPHSAYCWNDVLTIVSELPVAA